MGVTIHQPLDVVVLVAKILFFWGITPCHSLHKCVCQFYSAFLGVLLKGNNTQLCPP